MRFEEFARSHGLIIRDVIPDRWVSTPTEDHPRSRNGRYKFLGAVGWVQNWATMQTPSMWKTDDSTFDRGKIRQAIQKSILDREEQAKKASAKAGWILHQTYLAPHPYLEKKGFPDEMGNIWENDGKRMLVIPMRIAHRLVGCQLIDDQGVKKFLYGQHSKGASFVIDAKGIPLFCEGYATALSIRAAMKAIKMRYTLFVCFSASNIQQIAREVEGGIVIADRDPNGVGERSALDANKPYWLSDTVGEDFNDFHIRVGLFRASESLKKVIFLNNVAKAGVKT